MQQSLVIIFCCVLGLKELTFIELSNNSRSLARGDEVAESISLPTPPLKLGNISETTAFVSLIVTLIMLDLHRHSFDYKLCTCRLVAMV